MIKNRRKFLKVLGGFPAFLLPFEGMSYQNELESAVSNITAIGEGELYKDESFWATVKQAYSCSPTLLNLNNGGVSPQPRSVQEAVEHYNKVANEAPSYNMWKLLDRQKKSLRKSMAEFAGCSSEEIAFNRNATEALETVIFGIRLKEGDEVVLSKQDYPNMINAWKQRASRDGIVLKWVDLNLPSTDDNYLVDSYVNQINSKTKLVHLTHIINWNGQILPVKKIIEAIHAKGVEVLLDAAHSFGQLVYKISDLGCDYFGTSLHKWLCAPFGSGMLYVKKDKIKNLYPLFASPDPESDSISKFEHLGTRSLAIELGIAHALDFHQMIGSERKYKRLQYLKSYWTDAVKNMPGVSFGTPLNENHSAAICLLELKDQDMLKINQRLERDFSIHSVMIKWENIYGIRITPNVYTLSSDLDKFIEAIDQITNH